MFSDQYTVSAGEEITTDDVVAAGEYRVTVELDSAGTKTIEFDMNGCDSNTLFVPIYESGEFEPTVYTQC